MKTRPPSQTVFGWLRENLGLKAVGALTETDTRALQAAVQILDLMRYGDDEDLIKAFAACVDRMQRNCHRFAFHAIAHVLDWVDRPRIWHLAGLPASPMGQCKEEPEQCDPE